MNVLTTLSVNVKYSICAEGPMNRRQRFVSIVALLLGIPVEHNGEVLCL